jgi:hypothetical protein
LQAAGDQELIATSVPSPAFVGALPHVKSASVFATHIAFSFFKKDRKAHMVLLNIPGILMMCGV